MRTALRSLLRPAMITWAQQRKNTLALVPRAMDNPRCHAGGQTEFRILVVGDAFALGWGVLSHELGYPGQIARIASAHLARGVDVDLLAANGMPDLFRQIARADLGQYDAFVYICSVRAAATLQPPEQWRTTLVRILNSLGESSRGAAQVVVAGIRPVRSIPAFNSALGLIAERHAHFIDAQSEEVCNSRSRTTFVATSKPSPLIGSRYSTPEQYRIWASAIAQRIDVPRRPWDRGSRLTR